MGTVIENDTFTLNVYPEKKMVYHIVHGYLAGTALQELFNRGADEFEKNRCTKWLSDDRKSTALRKEDLEWTQNNWEPRVLKAGWKYWAIVLPEAVIGQMNMKPLLDRYSGMGIEVKIFSDPDEGLQWLESV